MRLGPQKNTVPRKSPFLFFILVLGNDLSSRFAAAEPISQAGLQGRLVIRASGFDVSHSAMCICPGCRLCGHTRCMVDHFAWFLKRGLNQKGYGTQL